MKEQTLDEKEVEIEALHDELLQAEGEFADQLKALRTELTSLKKDLARVIHILSKHL